MGFFSWLTADTEESVINTYAAADMGVPVRTVYQLQPNGEAPIEETAYEGYGIIGDEDVHHWLARRNLPTELVATLSDDDLSAVGVTLSVGGYYLDTVTGKKWTIFWKGPNIIDPTIEFFNGRYDQVIPEIGLSPNDLMQSGRFERQVITPEFPLKFSFDKNAVYEDLPASKTCPKQGYFFDDSDEDDDD